MKTIMQNKTVGFILILLAVASCTNKQEGGRSGMANQVKEYAVMAVKSEPTKLFKNYPTTLQGQQTVEIRSKIAGYIEQIFVDEGAFVKKGELLFRLNDNDLQAVARSAKALVAVAEADVNAARINVEKTRPLVTKNIISKFDLESVESIMKAKEAQLEQAKANLENAKANLQYTLITSPAEGTIGTFPYRVGSLVSSSSTEALTTVSNTKKMYAYFSFNEKEFLELTKGLKGENIQEKFSTLPDVLLMLADNSEYEYPGRIETASGLVNQSTGSINIRATFPNTSSLLRSGGSGSVRIPQHIESALIIPQKVTYELQGKHFVYVVGADNKVHNTEIGIIVGNLKKTYIVTSGLNIGDKVVLEGIASLRNNIEIKPKLVDLTNLSENTATENQVKN